jgi:diguanylate cyclase
MQIGPVSRTAPRRLSRAWWDDLRHGGFSRSATAGLVVVLVGVTAFALWSARAMHSAADQAYEAGEIAEEYSAVAIAMAAEESLERKYRLEPSPSVRATFAKTATETTTGLVRLADQTGPAERVRLRAVLEQHRRYLAGTRRMFAAVDRDDQEQVLAIDAQETDPTFDAMAQTVDAADRTHRATAHRALHELHELGTFTARATPVVFIIGLGLIGMFASVLRRVRVQLTQQRERALHDSLHDTLTGLPNRALLADRFEQALRTGREVGKATGLLLIDLDRFKEVNDTLGHHCGDELLKQVGPRLSRTLRDIDTVARLGGDEFAVLLPTVDGLDAVFLVAERLRACLNAPVQVDGIDLDLEASIGVVVSGEHGEDSATLLQRADVAMYVAKEQSLGVFAYDPDIDGNSPQRLALLGQLRRGMDRGELVLHYQPKVSLSTGDVCGVEALVRWQHPERGLIPPDGFIPLAEHTGLIGPLTRYVLDAALRQVRAWSDAGHVLPVAVNLSARNLLDDQIITQVTELLERHGVPPEMLELEVTESAIMLQQARAQQILTRLHRLGIRISIDDFGAGYTSLAQLKTLPITEIKVDRSFVSGMDTDSDAALIVRSVIDLGHNLGLTAVAEGVETLASMSALTGAGCDVVQGYHLSRPLPAQDLLAWYLARQSSGPPDGRPDSPPDGRPDSHLSRAPSRTSGSD